MEEFTNISRRSFLKGLAAGAVGTVLSGPISAFADSEAKEEIINLSSDQSFEIINADVLVIGGGNGGVYAAESAVEAGRTAAIIDKAPFRHNGVSGLSWDYFLGQNHTGAIQAMAATSTIENPVAYANAWNYVDKKNEHNRFVYEVNHGQTLPDRDENGHYIPFLTEDRTQGQFIRRHMDDLIEKTNVSIFDRTMVTDLIVNEGRCVGAIAIYLPTGDFRVFRANAVIMASGGCTQFYGWRGVSAKSINVPDNTADVDMAAYRHGARIINSEFTNYDVMSIYPEGLSCAFGAGVCGDAQEPQTISDKDGELLFDLSDERIWTDRSFFCRYMGEQIANGRGTENNAILISIGDSHLRYGNERNLAVLKKFGIDARKEAIEAEPEMFEHGGSPIVDENLMTEIPGLFTVRNLKNGAGVMTNYYTGRYVGKTAAEFAKNNGPVAIDAESVKEEIMRVNDIRTREIEGGYRPHEVRLAIQEAGYTGMGVYRTTEKMEAALEKLTYVREEMIDKMALADHSIAFNTEWKEAIENYNLLDIAEMSVRASLLREETRDAYVRAEFPEPDNDNWNCALACSLDNGTMKFEKVSF